MAERLGWSILTVRRALRYLAKHGYIELRLKRTGAKRGTIVTVRDYCLENQKKRAYSQDQKMILGDDFPGSENDPRDDFPGSEIRKSPTAKKALIP